MSRPTILGLVVAVGMALPSPATADLRVFACEPEWAALATEIGGDKVNAYAATHARQDPHYIRAKPSLISRIRRADLVICSGAGLEVGWLPLLLQRGARAGVQPGQPGYLMAADYVPVADIPTVVDRSLGDVHPEGNPHVHLDPRNLIKVAAELTKRMARIDPPNAAHYNARRMEFEKSMGAAIVEWTARAAPLAGMRVISHHKSWTYLINWLGLNEVGTLEAKPGIPPTASHLNSLLRMAQPQQVKAILRTPYDSATASEWLSGKTGIPAVMLPFTVERDAPPGALKDLFERTLALLEKAHGGP